MTSGLKNARILDEHSDRSAALSKCGQNAFGSPAPARKPPAASAMTAHPKTLASSVAARAAAAPSDAPPATTSTPRRAERAKSANALAPAASTADARDSPFPFPSWQTLALKASPYA